MKKSTKKVTQTEIVDPICLASRVEDAAQDNCSCCCCGEMDVNSVPEDICKVFDDILVDNSDSKKVYVTIGLFTIVRLTRKVELLIPVVDFCIPQNECIQSTDSNPCELFDKLKFPVDEFFPPEKCHFDSIDTVSAGYGCGCGCGN